MPLQCSQFSRDYDQKALDDAYDQGVYAPNRDQVLARRDRNSGLARQRLGEPRRFAYGPVALDFDNAPDCGGNLFVMADQVRRAIAWVYRNATLLGGDPQRLYVSGTSSGAHLGGVAATTDWERDFALPRDIAKGYTLCSGMYDLRAPRLSKRSAYVSFTDEMESALSPQRHLERIHAPIVLLYGSHETPEFKRQTQEFGAALQAAAKPVELVYAEGYNHFELAETLANPYGTMGRAVLHQMDLAATLPAAPAARGAPSPT